MSDSKDIEHRAEQLARKWLSDPKFLQVKVTELAARVEQLEGELQPFTGGDETLYSIANVADRLRLPYFNPSGEQQVMGQNVMHALLMWDGIIVDRGAEGYRLAKRYQRYGKTVSSIYKVKRTGEMKHRDQVKFTGEGLAYLQKRYNDDTRVYRVERWAGKMRFKAE